MVSNSGFAYGNGANASTVCAAVNWTQLAQTDPVYHAFVNQCCIMFNASTTDKHEQPASRQAPTAMETWLIGLLCVTVICASSVMSLAIFPCIRRSTYDLTIKFMVALAVGSLVATGCLFLIPEALGIASIDDDERFAGYQYRCATICAGVYLFFLGEQLIKKLVLGRRARSTAKADLRARAIGGDLQHTAIGDLPLTLVGYSPLEDNADQNGTLTQCNTEVTLIEDSEKGGVNDQSSFQITSTKSLSTNGDTISNPTIKTEHSVLSTVHTKSSLQPESDATTDTNKQPAPRRPIQPVAYMILLGDGLHNFIDGLAIGSAFTLNVLTGVSVSIAVLCEELPHELGDFAVMVNAGMSMKRAALYNFLCACSIFVGFAVGVLVGDAFHDGSYYIFSIAAGMFLYISLADMLPELVSGGHSHEMPGQTKKEHANHSHEGEDLVQKLGGRWLFVIQNLGILLGFSILFLLSIFGGHLENALMQLSI